MMMMMMMMKWNNRTSLPLQVRASLPIATSHKPYQTLEVNQQQGEPRPNQTKESSFGKKMMEEQPVNLSNTLQRKRCHEGQTERHAWSTRESLCINKSE